MSKLPRPALLVTTRIPHREPVHCQNRVLDGSLYEAESYGKRWLRRRSLAPASSAQGAGPPGSRPEDVVLRNRDKLFQEQPADPRRRQEVLSGGGRRADEMREAAGL